MMEIVREVTLPDIEDRFFKFETLTYDQYVLMMEKYLIVYRQSMELQTDMKFLKNNVLHLLKKIGLAKEDGTIRETLSMSSMLGVLMSLAKGDKKIKQDLAFLADLLPLLQKYENL
jgi:hypothetical protein